MPQNNPMPPMTKFNDYIFVLLGHNFDERTTTAVVTQLRQAGLLVKVVGLTPGQISGAHGLTLVPDLTLGKALTLASQVIGVIIPSASADCPALRNDPRLAELLERAYLNGAKFVIGPLSHPDRATLALLPVSIDEIIFYPKEQDLTLFVNELSGLFLERTSS